MGRMTLCIIFTIFTTSHVDTHNPLLIWEPSQTVLSYHEEWMAQHLNIRQIYWNLGVLHASRTLTNASYYHCYYNKPMREEILHALYIHTSPTRWNPHYLGQPVPPVMQEWLLGEKDHNQAINESYNILTKSENLETHTRDLIPYILPLIFNPQAIMSAFDKNTHVMHVIDRLRNKGITNVALSNAHNDMIAQLHHNTSLSPVLDTFDDINTSHNLGILKPDPQSVDAVAEHHNTTRENCILIEPEPHHHYTFKQNGLRSILYVDPQQIEQDIHVAIDS